MKKVFLIFVLCTLGFSRLYADWIIAPPATAAIDTMVYVKLEGMLDYSPYPTLTWLNLWVQAPNGTWKGYGLMFRYDTVPGTPSQMVPGDANHTFTAAGTWNWEVRKAPTSATYASSPTGTVLFSATTVVPQPTPTTFTFSNLSQSYDGSVKTASVTASPANAVFTTDLTKGPGTGSYTVTATAIGAFSGSGSATLVISAPPATPPAPTAAIVGTLPGSVSVDNKGSANYSIPLALAPGRSGLQPSLALSYSSDAGNGPLGIGWGLSYSPTKITRGRTVLARDGYVHGLTDNVEDRLYLDGRLLVLVNNTSTAPDAYWQVGNEYRTEVDSFVKITALGANGSTTGGVPVNGLYSGTIIEAFKVEAKDGTISYFGNSDGASADAIQTFYGFGGLYHAWALKRVVDAVGNSIEYRYNIYQTNKFNYQTNTAGRLSGEHLLAGIDYTANAGAGVDASFGVRLTYTPGAAGLILSGEIRPDAYNGYLGAGENESLRRLVKIESGPLSSGTVDPIIRYDFGYETSPSSGLSRLSNVTFNSKADSSGTWKAAPATYFTYSNDGADGHLQTPQLTSSSLPAALSDPYNSLRVTTGDFNGDGLPDKYFNGMVYLGNGTGFSAGVQWLPPNSDGWIVQNGDINGDGLADLVCISASSIYVGRSTGTGFVGGSTYLACSLGVASFDDQMFLDYTSAAASRVSLGDFDGDGRTDILIHHSNDNGGGAPGIYVGLSDGAVFSALSRWGIVNQTDVFKLQNVYDPYNNYQQIRYYNVTPIEPIIADFNADGISDYAYTERYVQKRTYLYDPPTVGYETWVRACVTQPRFPTTSRMNMGILLWQNNDSNNTYVSVEDARVKALAGDCNGDGYTDLLVMGKRGNLIPESKWCLFKGSAFGLIESQSVWDYMPLVEPATGVPTHNFHFYTADEYVAGLLYERGSGFDCSYAVYTDNQSQSAGMFLQDINHDGRADYVWCQDVNDAMGWWVKYGQKDGFGPAQQLWAYNQGDLSIWAGGSYTGYIDADGQGGVSMQPVDFDGDGTVDWLLTSRSVGMGNFPLIAKGRNGTVDRLLEVTNGTGAKTQIAYKSTGDSSIYTPGVAVSYPIKESRNARLVVSDIWQDSGTGNPGDRAQFSYQYSGDRIDLSGRGSLGFHSFVTLDRQTNLFKYQFLAQSFPMTGLTAREETYRYWNTGGSDKFRFISSHDNTVVFDKVMNGSTAYGTVWPFISKAVEYRWEDSATAHFSFTAAAANAQAENLFPQAKPAGEHIKITATSLFDGQSAVQTSLPGLFYASDTNPSGLGNVVAGTTNFPSYLTTSTQLGGSGYGKITYGNLKQLSTDFGDGFTETVDTAYLSPVGALTGRVDYVTTTVLSPVGGSEVAPVKRYTYEGNTPLVKTETIDATGTALDLTTTYTRDLLGRVTNTQINGNTTAGDYFVDDYSASSVTAFDSKWDLPTTSKNANPYLHTTTTAYHSFLGKPTSVTDVNGAQVTTVYDALGRVTKVRDELLGKETNTTFAWDSSQTVSVPAGVTGVALTSAYRVTTTATVSPATTAYYDRLGRVIRTIKEGFGTKQTITDTVYNKLGQTVAISLPYLQDPSPQILWTRTTYDPLGRVVTVTAPNGTVTTNAYKGRITQVSIDAPSLGGVDPAAQINSTLVDAKGRTVKVWNNDNQPALTWIAGSDAAATSSTAASIAFALDGFGRMRTTTLKGQTQTITATYDAHGRQLSLNDPDKGNWTYVNNALGQVTRQTDANSNVTTSTFDRLGRPLNRYTSGNSMTENADFYYYDTSTVTTSTRHTVAKGEKGWIGAPEREEASSSYATATANLHYYDDKGRPSLQMSRTDGKWFYTYSDYDAYSRPRQVRHYWKPSGAEAPGTQPYLWQDFGYTYQYDGSGSTSKSYLVGLTDSLGRSWWDSPNYDYLDRVTSVRKGGTLVTTRTYRDADGVLTAINTGDGGIQNLGFNFDGLGNLTSRTDAAVSGGETLTYDNLNRLKTSKQGTMTYAANGNVLNKPDVAGITSGTDFSYDAGAYTDISSTTVVRTLPHAVGSAYGYTMKYDLNGNLLSRSKSGDVSSVKWAGFDKPRWMAKTTNVLNATAQAAVGSEFQYNAARSRVMQLEFTEAKDTGPTKYNRKRIYAMGSTLELNYTTATPALNPTWDLMNIRIYVPGPDGVIGAREFSRPTPAASFAEKAIVYHYDHLGSITATTQYGSSAYATDGNVKPGKFSEDAWGQRRDPLDWLGAPDPNQTDDGGANSVTPRGYTGHEMLDDLGLVHMNGRIYDPLLGRFLSADLRIDGIYSLQGYNRYSYVHNNPLSFTDPDGQAAVAAAPLVLLEGGGATLLTSTAAVATPVTAIALGSSWLAVNVPATDPRFEFIKNCFEIQKRQDAQSQATNQQAASNAASTPKQPAENPSEAAKPKENSSGGQMDPNKNDKDKMAKIKEKGQEGEAKMKDGIAKEGESVSGEQVTIVTSKGTRTRVDATSTNGQTQVVNESKNGPTARLSPGQKDLKDDVANARPVTPVGGNAQAAGFTPGQPTTFDRFVEWLFGKDKK